MASLKDQASARRVSKKAKELKGSEIIRLAGEINEKIKSGQTIYNFTIGDFDPTVFPIPSLLREEIIKAYTNNETNYPAADGILSLRKEVASFIKDEQHLSYELDEFLIAGGARPLIYALYETLVDSGDKVIFPVPSWNNNHYTFLSGGNAILIETQPENNYMPTATEIEPHVHDATILALCSPLNPTGTTFTRESLVQICEVVLRENERRGTGSKPLYILYDQIYWQLTYNDTKHVDPVSLVPGLRPFTIYIDGISKSLAATGVRIGWAFGPKDIIAKMKSILGHIGAWAPKPEQVATAAYLKERKVLAEDMTKLKSRLHSRLQKIFEGIMILKSEGFSVNAIAPQAAIYLTVQFDLIGKTKLDGTQILTTADTTAYLLNDAGLAIVPFYAFGASENSSWFRISVGTVKTAEIPSVIDSLRISLKKLKDN